MAKLRPRGPDGPPWPDPYYADAAWYLEAICAPEAWAAGYTGAGVQILINDDEGVDNTHPDLGGSTWPTRAACMRRARK